MADVKPGGVLQIKKYPNRRFYDSTRSEHVTLHEVYELVKSGYDVTITDTRSGEDITNSILLQIILEKDQPKLLMLPPSVLHMLIRSQSQALQGSLERVFGPFMQMMSASQTQFDSYLKEAMGNVSHGVPSPLEWANSMLGAFNNNVPPSPTPDDTQEPTHQPAEEPPITSDQREDEAELDELRAQMEELTKQVNKLGAKRRRDE